MWQGRIYFYAGASAIRAVVGARFFSTVGAQQSGFIDLCLPFGPCLGCSWAGTNDIVWFKLGKSDTEHLRTSKPVWRGRCGPNAHPELKEDTRPSWVMDQGMETLLINFSTSISEMGKMVCVSTTGCLILPSPTLLWLKTMPGINFSCQKLNFSLSNKNTLLFHVLHCFLGDEMQFLS